MKKFLRVQPLNNLIARSKDENSLILKSAEISDFFFVHRYNKLASAGNPQQPWQ